MEKILETFIGELFSCEGIPVHTIRLPCNDWSWLDFGLRRDILGMGDQTESMQQHLENLVNLTVGYLFEKGLYRVRYDDAGSLDEWHRFLQRVPPHSGTAFPKRPHH